MSESSEIIPSAPKKKGPMLAIIIILVVVAAAILAGVYFVFLRGGSTKSSFLSKITPLNGKCKYNDPDLCKFVNNWKDIKYFTANMTSTFEGKSIKTTMKSVGDDRSQIISYQGDKEDMNIISIGNDTYTKDPTDGKWIKTTRAAQTDSSLDVNKGFGFDDKAEKVEDKTTYKKIGTEACGKLTCFKYQIVDPSVADSTEYILFDNKEYLLRKTISIGKDNNKAEAEFDYSKISIDIPSPVKEGTSVPSSTLPSSATSGGTVSESQLNQAINDAQQQAASTTDSTADTATDTVPVEP